MPGHISKTKKHAKLVGQSAQAVAVRDAIVKRLLTQIYSLCPHLGKADLPLARRFCEFEYILSLALAEIRRRESLDMFNGANDNLLNNYRRFTQTQLQIANSLGLTPASRAMLRLNKAESPDDLVAAFASDQKRSE